MSREALSLDISRVVSRVVSGEPIDTAENGAALAAKYPEIGMSAAAISQAIERAAGMVGMIKSAPEPVRPLRMAVTIAEAKPPAPANGHQPPAKRLETVTANIGEATVAPPAPLAAAAPAVALSFDDALAAAIDAEIGNLVSGQNAKPATAKPIVEALSAAPAIALAPPVAPIEPRPAVSMAAKAAPEMRTEPAAEEPQPAPEPVTDMAEPAALPPAKGSLLSSFRRALFRT